MTTSKSKAKGTGGEREVRKIMEAYGVCVFRSSPSEPYDLFLPGDGDPIQVLCLRPDYGRWLAILPLEQLAPLLHSTRAPIQIEVKRHAKSSVHTIWQEKFGKD